MSLSPQMIEMLHFATPFAPERIAGSDTLVRPYDEFLSDLGNWCREKVEQMYSMVPERRTLVGDYLSLTCNRLFKTSQQLGDTYEEIMEGLATVSDSQRDPWFTINLFGNIVHVRNNPEVLLFCILKRDILHACCNSNASALDLSTMFCGIIYFPDRPRHVLKLIGFLFYDFTKETARRDHMPLWVQTEPVAAIKDSLTIAFRRNFLGLDSRDPIITASVDYQNFPVATRTRKDESGTCTTHPRSILYTYDPFDDFSLPRNFRTYVNFEPAKHYGENFELYGGENLVCIKAGEVDIQNISLICTTRRLAEYAAHVDFKLKVVSIHFEGTNLEFSYQNIPEEAYYDFLVSIYNFR